MFNRYKLKHWKAFSDPFIKALEWNNTAYLHVEDNKYENLAADVKIIIDCYITDPKYLWSLKDSWHARLDLDTARQGLLAMAIYLAFNIETDSYKNLFSSYVKD